MTAVDAPEVRWQLAQLLARLDLDDAERILSVARMVRLYEESPNARAEANALQAVAELARGHPDLEAMAQKFLQRALGSFSATLWARAWRLTRLP